MFILCIHKLLKKKEKTHIHTLRKHIYTHIQTYIHLYESQNNIWTRAMLVF